MGGIRKIAVLCLSFFIMSGCEQPPGAEVVYTIYLKNNSEKLIYHRLSKIYPVLTIEVNDNSRLGALPPGEIAMFDSKKPWRETIDELPADTLSIILFDSDTVERYGWEIVNKEHKVLKRWNVGADYLEQRNWTLTYPD